MTDAERIVFYTEPWKFYVEPFRIVGNLYFVGNRSVGSYLLKTYKGVVIIDTGYPITVPLLFQSLAKLGVSIDEIKHVFHTHGHYDHFGATGYIKEFSKCITYLGRRDAEMFKNDKKRSFIQDAHVGNFDIFKPDVLLEGGERFDFGDVVLDVLATPGHSDGCMSFFFDEKEKAQVVRCGLFGGAGINTLTKGYIEEYGNTHSPQEFLKTLDRLALEHVDVMLGNHTSQGNMLAKYEESKIKGCQSPFINPLDFQQFISLCRKRFEAEGYMS